jgi:hypothetical protein
MRCGYEMKHRDEMDEMEMWKGMARVNAKLNAKMKVKAK